MANYEGSCGDCVHYTDESRDDVLGQCNLQLAPCIAYALGLKNQYDQDAPEFLTHHQWSCSFGSYAP